MSILQTLQNIKIYLKRLKLKLKKMNFDTCYSEADIYIAYIITIKKQLKHHLLHRIAIYALYVSK